jgi:hypothetical protein
LFQDGGIIKRVITAGEGYDTPNDGSQVSVQETYNTGTVVHIKKVIRLKQCCGSGMFILDLDPKIFHSGFNFFPGSFIKREMQI